MTASVVRLTRIDALHVAPQSYRALEEDLRTQRRLSAGDRRVGDINGTPRHAVDAVVRHLVAFSVAGTQVPMPVPLDRRAVGHARDDAQRRVAAARNVDRDPGFVEERRPRRLGDDAGPEIRDRIPVLLVVAVDEASQEDGAPARRVTVEGKAVVVDQPVGTRPDDRVGGGLVTLDRRGRAGRRRVLRIARNQRARPALAAVERLVDAQPGVAGFGPSREARQIDRAVVVASADQMQRISGRGGDRRFVLALEEGIAPRPLRP